MTLPPNPPHPKPEVSPQAATPGPVSSGSSKGRKLGLKKSPFRRRTMLLLIAAAVVVGGVVGWSEIQARLLPTKSKTEGLITERARVSSFEILVVERGALDSMKNAVLTSKVEGATTIISLVPEGSHVKEGDLVCELDASTLNDKETQQEIAVVKAKAMLEQATEDLAIQKTQNDSDLAAAQLKYDLAKLDLEKFQKGDLIQQLEDFQAAVKLADETLSRTRESCNYIRQMTQKGYKNQNDLESEELVLQRNELDKRSAETKLRAFENYTQKRTLKELEANALEFAREIERIDRKGKAALAQKEAELESCKLTLEVESKKHDRMKEQIKACKIYASQDGQVVYANTRDGRQSDQVLIEVGSSVRERQAIINLPDLDAMKVNARIHESRISLIRQGLQVTVKVDAYPGEVFHGEVDSVASVPSSTGGFNRDFKEYEAVIRIVDSSEKVNKLRPGLTASVEVMVDHRDSALQIPVQSVVSIGGRQFVFMVDGETVQRTEIKVGQSNDKMIEIASGLSEGAQVVMNPRSSFRKEIDELESQLAKELAEQQEKDARDPSKARPAPAIAKPMAPSGSESPAVGGPMAAGGPPSGSVQGGGGRPNIDPVERFKAADKNGDGKITRDEADERMASRFENFDANGDGGVTQEEMTAAFARFRASGGGAGPRPPAN